MARPLDVDGQVSIVADDDAEILLQANGSVIRIQMPSLLGSYRLLRKAGPARVREQLVTLLRTGATEADLEVQFTVANQVIAELDTRSQGSALTRWLGLGPIKLHPLTMLMSLVKKSK